MFVYFGVNDVSAVEEKVAAQSQNMSDLVGRFPHSCYTVNARQILIQRPNVLEVEFPHRCPFTEALGYRNDKSSSNLTT